MGGSPLVPEGRVEAVPGADSHRVGHLAGQVAGAGSHRGELLVGIVAAGSHLVGIVAAGSHRGELLAGVAGAAGSHRGHLVGVVMEKQVPEELRRGI